MRGSFETNQGPEQAKVYPFEEKGTWAILQDLNI